MAATTCSVLLHLAYQMKQSTDLACLMAHPLVMTAVNEGSLLYFQLPGLLL